jgi:hypothetical protein
VKIGIRSGQTSIIEKVEDLLPEILPIDWKKIESARAEHWFSITESLIKTGEFCIYKNSEWVGEGKNLSEACGALESRIRLTVAEYAENFVFLHAGVVSRKKKAIVIPGKSFSGKTTLVSELIKRGCEYLSDEYAVLDREGLVHPFPKKLSLRGIIDDFRQVDLAVEELGGVKSLSPVPVGVFLTTRYKKGRNRKEIKRDAPGEGVLDCVANSISVRRNPQFVLEVLGLVAERATFLSGERGEAAEYAEYFLEYLDEKEFSSADLTA